MKYPKRLWAVMKAIHVRNIKAGALPCRTMPGDPEFIIPVFRTKKAAIKWNGSKENIKELAHGPELPGAKGGEGV